MSDLRSALRHLRREPAAALLAILTIGLGIGATTFLFSVANGVLLEPLPFPAADRLVRVTETRAGRAARIPGTMSNGTFNAWRESPATIEGLTGWMRRTATLEGVGDPSRVLVAIVSPAFFDVLGVRPLLGRVFVEADAPAGESFQARNIAIISYGLWRERFGAQDSVLDRTLELDGRRLTIVGVMPRTFAFPERETRIWTPFAVGSVKGSDGSLRVSVFSGIARLRPDVTPAQASAEATARARNAPDSGMAGMGMFGSKAPPDISAVPAVDAMTADVKPAILILLGAVTLLLVTATANVANIQLARTMARRREIAVRSALGAGTGRIVRQLFTEHLLVGATGGGVGLALTLAFQEMAPRFLPADFPRLDNIDINIRVLLFAAAISVVVSVAFGVLPALQARRLNLVVSLADDGTAPVGWSARSRTARFRGFIMATQVALACVLLIGAALLGRSFRAMLHADRAYDASNVLTALVPLPSPRYAYAQRASIADAMLTRLRSMPGVTAAGFASGLPLSPGTGGTTGLRLRSPLGRELEVQTALRIISPGYLEALRLRLLEGRVLTDSDTSSSLPVALVNRAFAKQYLDDRAIGVSLPIGLAENRRDAVVVGVVEDVRQRNVTGAAEPEVLLTFRQVENRPFDASIVVRTSGDPLALASDLRAIARSAEPSLALDAVMTMEDRVMGSLAKPRLYAALLSAFALVAALVAGAGLFGVLSYSVAQRSREIGVRTALGAQRTDVIALVLKQAAVITGAGLIAGLGAAAILVRWISALIYGVSARDPLSFAGVSMAIALAAGLACVIPARRAARIDPLRALRGQ
jgi:predicted permease